MEHEYKKERTVQKVTFVIDPNFQPVDYWTNFNGTDLLGLVYNDTKRSVINFTNYLSSLLESNDSGFYLRLAASLWSAAHKMAKYEKYLNPKKCGQRWYNSTGYMYFVGLS